MTAQDHQEFLPTDLPKEIPAHSSVPPLPHVDTHQDEHDSPQHQEEHYEDVRTLLAWQAPGRPFRKRGREYYMSTLLIMLLLEIILFLFSQYMLMMVVLSLVFVSFALASVPPLNFHYRISSEGITIEDHFFLWEELYDFYFKKRDGVEILHIRTRSFLPGELTLTLGSIDKPHVKSVLLPYLPYREVVRPTFMEKSADWMTKNFPLEKQPPPSHPVAP